MMRIRYAIDPDKAAVVQKIYRWYADGIDITDIAQRLNKAEILPPKGKGLWDAERVMRVLFRRNHREKYLGNMLFNCTRWNKKYKKRTPKAQEEWVICPNAHEAIITQKIAQAVQQRYENAKLSIKESERNGKNDDRRRSR